MVAIEYNCHSHKIGTNICGFETGDSRNKTRLAKVVVVANSKQKVFSWTQLVVKYTSKNFGYDYTLYWI